MRRTILFLAIVALAILDGVLVMYLSEEFDWGYEATYAAGVLGALVLLGVSLPFYLGPISRNLPLPEEEEAKEQAKAAGEARPV